MRWFGNVDRMGEDNWLNKVRTMNVQVRIGSGRPKQNLVEIAQGKLWTGGLSKEVAQDGATWRATKRGTRLTHASM